MIMKRRTFIFGMGTLLGCFPLSAAEKPVPLVVAVMDPLALDLACFCIKGFAQRQYRVLAEHLQSELERPVACVFSESLKSTFLKSPTGKIDLLLGKEDAVLFDAENFKMEIEPLAKLTDAEGKTTHHGVLVVEKNDPAQTLGDLQTHQIIFGPEYSRERHIEPVRMLRQSGVAIPQKPYCLTSDKDAALKILDHSDGDVSVRMSAAMAAYSLKLMEGCQTVEKGTLRILARTSEVPFITAFAAKSLGRELVPKIRDAFLSFGKNEKNLVALESKSGFISGFDEKQPG